MSDVIKNPRNGCALHGALQTIQEIEGVVPVVHANAGCGVISYLSGRKTGGGEARYGGFATPGTAAQERHVIFGGASRLREQIKNSIKVVNGELYVILNSCESAMVGDDVDAMTREIVEQGEPVVDTLIAGFNGGSHYGYEHVFADILKSVNDVKKSEGSKDEKLVNIFGVVPGKDIYWQGNLEEIRRILEGVGLKANVFFGIDGGVDNLVNAKNAALSIVFSRWGESPAKLLKNKYDIPFINVSALPVSFSDEKELIESISVHTNIDDEIKEEFLKREEKYENYYLRRVQNDVIEYSVGKRVVIVADEEQTIRYGRIIKEHLGGEIAAVVLTDSLKKDEEHETDNTELLKNYTEKIYITSDEKDIEDIVRQSKAELILGSSLEKHIAGKLGLPLIEVSYPIYDKEISNYQTAGVRGIANFVSEYISVIKVADATKKRELNEFVKSIKSTRTDVVSLIHTDKSTLKVKQLYTNEV